MLANDLQTSGLNPSSCPVSPLYHNISNPTNCSAAPSIHDIKPTSECKSVFLAHDIFSGHHAQSRVWHRVARGNGYHERLRLHVYGLCGRLCQLQPCCRSRWSRELDLLCRVVQFPLWAERWGLSAQGSKEKIPFTSSETADSAILAIS